MKKIIKEVIGFDEGSFCGSLAYGYSNKRKAIKAIEKMTGEKIENPEDMEKLKVIRFKDKNGDDCFTWIGVCEHCGQKNNGVWSWADFC